MNLIPTEVEGMSVRVLGLKHLLYSVMSYKEDDMVLTGCRQSLQWTSNPLPYYTASEQEPLELRESEWLVILGTLSS